MKAFRKKLFTTSLGLIALPGLFAFAVRPVYAGGLKLADPAGSETSSDLSTAEADASATAAPDVRVEPSSEPSTSRKDVPWLGVSTVEASEALTSQLDLDPGVGLVINYVVAGSPADKAGLRKNDVLTQFDDQTLVHPAQLRKLVRVHHDGGPVKLGYYRAGKHETASVTLGQTRAEPGLWEDGERAFRGNLKDLQKQLRDLHFDETIRDQMKVLRDSLGSIKIDQKEVQEDIRQGMDQARNALREAMRNMTNADSVINPVRNILENLAHSGVLLDNRADVVVRSSNKNVKTMVKSDESGTIVILSNPGLQLTAHDKDGKLLFDGPIDTEDQRAQVPKDLWQKVEPLVDQMHSQAEPPEANEPEKKDDH